jgi:hypothetical protein
MHCVAARVPADHNLNDHLKCASIFESSIDSRYCEAAQPYLAIVVEGGIQMIARPMFHKK